VCLSSSSRRQPVMDGLACSFDWGRLPLTPVPHGSCWVGGRCFPPGLRSSNRVGAGLWLANRPAPWGPGHHPAWQALLPLRPAPSLSLLSWAALNPGPTPQMLLTECAQYRPRMPQPAGLPTDCPTEGWVGAPATCPGGKVPSLLGSPLWRSCLGCTWGSEGPEARWAWPAS